MGKVTNNTISGLVGSVVFYTRGDQTFVRARPAQHKKSKKRTAGRSTFSIVTRNGTPMLTMVKDMFSFPLKLIAYNRIRAWIRQLYITNNGGDWPLSHQYGMCQLNPDTDLRDIIRPVLTVSSTGTIITITIPAMDPLKEIIAPPRASGVIIKAIAVTSRFDEPCPKRVAENAYSFPYVSGSLAAKEIILDAKAAAGEMAVVYISVMFEVSGANGYLNDARWLPVAAVGMGRV